MTDYGMRLAPQHAEMLAASRITPEHARARGYVTVDTKVRLDEVGITKAGRHVPGLLVPSLRPDGSTWGYQYRPDSPRLRDGKPVKYETPVGQRNGMDVPPGVGDRLGDPAVPLWVTEGAKKADAAALAGLCCVDLPGVWSWLGTNPKGGKVALDDWRDIALNGRRVVLAFDSDVAAKESVRKALDALAGYLATKGAEVSYCHLPHDAAKAGLDDYLAAGHDADDLWRLVRPEAPAIVAESAPVEQAAPLAPVSQRPPRETGALLEQVRRWLGRYICTMHDADLDLLTLWAAHTHLCMETFTTPRLVLDSPVPGAGKTTTLEHLDRLCLHAVQMASLSSPALLTRMLDNGLRTVLIDEADRSLNPDKEGVAELLAVLNSGYKRGGTRPVLTPTKDGWNVTEMPTFAPVVMAGNNPQLPEDTRSRSIRVLLLPDLVGRVEESDWELIDEAARKLGSRLGTWADQVRDFVRVNRPPLPEGITGRARERWSPLKRVAAAAGGRWPEVVDTLALHDKEQTEMDRDDGMIRDRPAVVLLKHLLDLWPEGETFYPTSALCRDLADTHPDDWGHGSPFGKPITAQRLGRMLASSYGVNSHRLDREGPRGYTRASLEPVWRRMGLVPDLAPVPSPPPKETGASGAAGETGVRSLNLAHLPGRCQVCGFHTETQGHARECTEVA
jgi:hypothetical protein